MDEGIQKAITEFFFPARCIGCGKWGSFLCRECVINLPHIEPPFCNKCGKPESSGTFCPNCWGWQSAIDGIRSVFRFDGIIRKAIHELKYYHVKAISNVMALYLANFISEYPLSFDIIVPVPLHKNRLKQRGYNQSSLLATELAKIKRSPMLDDYLFRVKDSPAQARTSNVEQRKRNVVDAFICKKGELSGKCVALIDDVCTTGATLEACAKALKAAGVQSVWGLTLAREI